MSGSLITKLQRFTELDKADRGALGRFEAEVRDFRAGSDVITQGTQPDRVHLLVQGWGCRYKLLPTGKRQIVAYLILAISAMFTCSCCAGWTIRSACLAPPRWP